MRDGVCEAGIGGEEPCATIAHTLILTVSFLIAGCASDVMKQYMGKDIRELFIEHGKPSNEFVLADGRRVFQFSWGESSAGSQLGMKGGCLLSYITERDDPNDRWVVVEYRYPDRMFC